MAAAASAPAAVAPNDAPPPARDDAPRIYSKRRHAWIFYEPSTSSGWTGFLGLGGSVKLKDTKARPGSGCATFYAVEPRGFVCLNEKTTLDPNDPEYRAVARFAPKLEQPFPHQYGESRGLPRYFVVPTEQQQLKKEYRLAEHLDVVRAMRDGSLTGEAVPKMMRGIDVTLAGQGQPPEWSLLPAKIAEERDYLKPQSTVAWSEQFDANGRTWLITGDLALVPKDKVTPYPKSDFRGVALQGDVRLPIAFIRGQDRTRFEKQPDGSIKQAGQWRRLSWFAVEYEPVEWEGKQYVIGRDGRSLALLEDVTVASPSPASPWGSYVEGIPEARKAAEPAPRVTVAPGGRRTWLEVSVLGGWLIAYEDTRPVYATMIAPGRGGVPTRGKDPLETASTPTGTFRIDGKFKTATMANEAFVHSEVPFAQNFHGPHALHMAYWHDDWGQKKSAGCINLSPVDARWLFFWTEPAIPEGWHGMRSDKQAGPATVVWVHK